MPEPTRLDKTTALSWPELAQRFLELADRHLRSVPSGCMPSIQERLDYLACREAIARKLRDQVPVCDALLAGATWAEMADATGADVDQMRSDFARWLRAQREQLGYAGYARAVRADAAGNGWQA